LTQVMDGFIELLMLKKLGISEQMTGFKHYKLILQIENQTLVIYLMRQTYEIPIMLQNSVMI